MRLKDKVAVITGAGRGIGRDIALAYAREGAHVVINDVDPATSETTARDAAQLGSKSLAVVASVADTGGVNRLIDTVVRERGRIDIVVNNAMRIVPGKLEELPESAWDATMNVGLKGAFMVSQAAARHMIRQNSVCFVNIASIAGLFPYNWAGAYSVVKAGLLMLTKLQAMEWAPMESARMQSRRATFGRREPRRCTPTPRFMKVVARESRWAGLARAKTSRESRFSLHHPMRSTRLEASLVRMADKQLDIS